MHKQIEKDNILKEGAYITDTAFSSHSYKKIYIYTIYIYVTHLADA